MITILNRPVLFTPVYNTHPLYIKVESDKTGEEAFNFLFDLYVNDNFVNRVNLLPRPGTNEALYSPARILESYVSYDGYSYVNSGDTSSLSDVVQWRVECGEEYVFYWPFFDTQINFDLLTRLVNNTGVKHTFVLGDKIIVDSPLYPYFNGIHTIVEIVDEYIVVINKLFIVTPTNPGTAVIQSKLKTEFFDIEMISNPNIVDTLGGFTLYGPDAGGNSSYLIALPPPLTPPNLFIFELLDSTIIPNNTITSTATTDVVPMDGIYYEIEFDAQCNFAFDTYDQHYIQVIVGGNPGKRHYGLEFDTKTFKEIIQCGFSYDDSIVIVFGMEGADTTLGASYYIAMSRFSINTSPIGYSWNAVVQYIDAAENFWDFFWNKYSMTTDNIFGLGKFLTNQPLTVKTKIGDYGSIGWLNVINQELIPNKKTYMRVTTVNDIFFTTYDIEINNMSPYILTSPQNRIIEFGIYPQNLNNYGQTYLGYDIIDEYVIRYSAQLFVEEDSVNFPGDLLPLSEIRNFDIDKSCDKYEPVRFAFLNSLGQFDYYNATLLSRTTISGTRDTFTKTLGFDYGIGDRGKTVINVNTGESYIIHTDWISEETANWLSYEFFNSTEVYVYDDSLYPTLIPIILDTTSIEVKKRVNDKLLNYTFNYSKAVPLNNQRN